MSSLLGSSSDKNFLGGYGIGIPSNTLTEKREQQETGRRGERGGREGEGEGEGEGGERGGREGEGKREGEEEGEGR